MMRGLAQKRPAPFGVGGGGTPTPLNAVLSGIDGRVQAISQGTQTQNDDAPLPLDQSLYLPATTQGRTGSTARILEQLFVDISVKGDLPQGTSPAAMRAWVINTTYIEPRIGGVPQLQIPLAAAVDTRKIDRSFKLRARLNLGDFQSLVWHWSSDSITLPLAFSLGPDPEYSVSLTILAGFSPPLIR